MLTDPRLPARKDDSGLPSGREREIIALVAEGFRNRDIGHRLGISDGVVKNYLTAIFDKLGLWNRSELALWYLSRVPSNSDKPTA
jgi:DNA-binding NarL/FixJ family response regulator